MLDREADDGVGGLGFGVWDLGLSEGLRLELGFKFVREVRVVVGFEMGIEMGWEDRPPLAKTAFEGRPGTVLRKGPT